MQIICPQCQQAMQQTKTHCYCPNNHSFDTAKQGYTNLLLVQNKKSKSPGDSSDMVSARKRFLSQGHYQALTEAINHLVIRQLAKVNSAVGNIIDAGCGEGYYSHALQQAIQTEPFNADITGIDISKFAVKAAASRNKSINWFVANSRHLPVADHSADILLSLFSPIPEQEFKRVLAAKGLLILATTGRNHLIELRNRLYDEVDDSTLDPIAKLANSFIIKEQRSIQFTLELKTTQAILDLLAMTPHYWRASPTKKQALATLKQMALSIDINLYGLTLKHDK